MPTGNVCTSDPQGVALIVLTQNMQLSYGNGIRNWRHVTFRSPHVAVLREIRHHDHTSQQSLVQNMPIRISLFSHFPRVMPLHFCSCFSQYRTMGDNFALWMCKIVICKSKNNKICIFFENYMNVCRLDIKYDFLLSKTALRAMLYLRQLRVKLFNTLSRLTCHARHNNVFRHSYPFVSHDPRNTNACRCRLVVTGKEE